MSEKPLTPWVVSENSGKVLSAHCDCMAAFGESCSYVASFLQAIEPGCKCRASVTVTEKRHTGFYQHQSCPSHSLIMSICHPEIPHFNTEATKWGSHYEKRARDAYCRYQKEMHVNAIANAVVLVDVRLRH